MIIGGALWDHFWIPLLSWPGYFIISFVPWRAVGDAFATEISLGTIREEGLLSHCTMTELLEVMKKTLQATITCALVSYMYHVKWSQNPAVLLNPYAAGG